MTRSLYDIVTASVGLQMRGHQVVTDQWKPELERRLANGESLRSIAKDKGVCYQTLQYWRDKWGLEKLKQKTVSGADHPNWRGGVVTDRYGYRLIYTLGRKAHPYSYEHVLVAEQKLGRRLYKGEHVHHVNGEKLDNRPENLIVVSDREHKLLHAQLQTIAMTMVRSGEIVFENGGYRRV